MGLGSLWRAPEVILLLGLCACCFTAPLFTSPLDATRPGHGIPPAGAHDLDQILSPPSGRHWLGTDFLGRDLLARLLEGGRTTIGIALGAALVAALVGVTAGLLAGFVRGALDALLGRLMEVADSVPSLLVALAVAATGRGEGALPLIGIVAMTRWTDMARLARSEALAWRTATLDTARASGAGSCRLLARHLLPSSLPMLCTAAALVAVEAIEVEAALGLLGLGIAPPAATWGNLLLEARLMLDQAWWTALFPGGAICVAVLGLLGAAQRLGSPLQAQSGIERRGPPSPARR